jgi:hypothetical protein
VEKPAGHAFISYVREDSREVDKLQRTLEVAGVSVWRDTANLWPGEDWRLKIRRAIIDNALVFIACFSSRSIARKRSYQNEELLLAIEQLRLRRPDDPWLIPVRFEDCDVPDLEIGGGRSLSSIQRADLFGDQRDAGIARLVSAVLRILGEPPDFRVKRQRQVNVTQLNTGATGELKRDDILLSPQAGQAAGRLQYRLTESIDSLTTYSTAGVPLPAMSGKNSKLLEINLSSGRYLLRWITEGKGHFCITDEMEKDGRGAVLLTALVPDPRPEGEQVVRLGESGRHLLNVKADRLDWAFTFMPI